MFSLILLLIIWHSLHISVSEEFFMDMSCLSCLSAKKDCALPKLLVQILSEFYDVNCDNY
jgi:hypothetical protein